MKKKIIIGFSAIFFLCVIMFLTSEKFLAFDNDHLLNESSLMPSLSEMSEIQSEENVYDEGTLASNQSVEKDSNIKIYDILLVFLFLILICSPVPLIFYLVDYSKITRYSLKKIGANLNFGLEGKKISEDKKKDYWREIPVNKDLEIAFWTALQYNVVPTSVLKEGIIGAILLKWFKEEKISISKTRKGLFNFRDNNYAIDFSDFNFTEDLAEYKLLQILQSASGYNNVLEAREFKRWCTRNYGAIEKWFYELALWAQNKLEQQGIIDVIKEEKRFLFTTYTKVYKNVSPSVKEEAIKLIGLKNFFEDFSIIDKREYFEVHIWEEYLIFAQLLGVADKVESQFGKLYPKFNNEPKFDINFDTTAIRNMAHLGYKGYEEGKRKKYI